jgi:phytoene dehydrogenase-like protein
VRPWEVSDFDAPKQPNFYVHNPSYTDKTCAPEGCDSVMILMPVANFQVTLTQLRGTFSQLQGTFSQFQGTFSQQAPRRGATPLGSSCPLQTSREHSVNFREHSVNIRTPLCPFTPHSLPPAIPPFADVLHKLLLSRR